MCLCVREKERDACGRRSLCETQVSCSPRRLHDDPFSLLYNVSLCVGAETQCLDALRHATNPHRLSLLLPSLLHACGTMHSYDLNLFAAAAGVNARTPWVRLVEQVKQMASGVGAAAELSLAGNKLSTAAAESPSNAAAATVPETIKEATALTAALRAPYPPPPSLNAQTLSQTLFDGYAAAWLSMVAAQRVETNAQGEHFILLR